MLRLTTKLRFMTEKKYHSKILRVVKLGINRGTGPTLGGQLREVTTLKIKRM